MIISGNEEDKRLGMLDSLQLGNVESLLSGDTEDLFMHEQPLTDCSKSSMLTPRKTKHYGKNLLSAVMWFVLRALKQLITSRQKLVFT